MSESPKLNLVSISSEDLDALLREFPALKDQMTVAPAPASAIRDQELGLLNVLIELGPPTLNFATALLTFLAARYNLKAK